MPTVGVAMASPFQKRWVRVLAIVLAVLVAVVFVVSLVLDSILTKRAQAEAATLSQQLGRPVSIGRVSTSFLTGLGATVSGLEVGAAPDEEVPLAQVKELGVKVAALRALFSLGKDIVVRSVEVDQPVVNVVRLRDGTTNLERLQDRLAEQQKSKPAEPPSTEARDLSAVRVDHAEVNDGRVRLVDRSTGKTRELGISDLDVTIDDLRAGKPLDVVVKAALLADKQNLELRLHTAPLPNSLQPTPERVMLKIQPVDLAPLGPFLPKDARLEAGRLDADWTAELGAAVPGGKGPTKAKGGIHARGLRFTGTSAAPIDVTVDTDLDGNAETGDLDIRTLALAIGQAGVKGKGRVRNLASETPSIENFEIVGHDLDPAVIARSFPALAKALKGQVAGPIGLTVRGSGTQAAPTVAVTLDFTPVRLAIPQQLSKAAGAPMTLVTHLRGAGRNTYRFDADLDLAGADLRPGQLLDKPPGRPMALSLKGSASRGGTTRVKLESVVAARPRGHARRHRVGRAAGRGQARHHHLRPRRPRSQAGRGRAAAGERVLQGAATPGGPAPVRRLSGKIHVEVAALIFHKVPWKNVLLDATMQDDLVKLDRFSMDAAGGQVRLDGTSVRLGPVEKPWDVKLAVKSIDLAQALTFGGKGKAFAGIFDGNIALAGKGTTLTAVEKTVDGKIDGNLKNGAFLGADLVSAVAGPLAKALPFATKSLGGPGGEGGRTSLGENLGIAMTVDNGVAKLTKPINVQLPQANVSLGGGVGLSGALALAGTVALTPQTIKTLTGGKVTPPEPIPVALSLSGPAWAPQITGLDVTPAALTIAKLAGASTLRSLFGESDVGKTAGGVLGGALGGSGNAGTAQPPTHGEQKAQSEAEQLRQQAAEDARKRLQGLFGK